jgi:sugar/nucleoside kinase (ribokinase family)
VIDVVVIVGVFREVLNGDTTPRPRLGGSGLIAAIIAARFGARTALVSYVGEEDATAAVAMLDTAGVDSRSLVVVPGASGTFVYPAEEKVDAPPWPMYRPGEAQPEVSPLVPEAKVYVVFGIPDFDPVAAGWIRTLATSALLLWDRQGWISRARDSRAVSKLAPQRKIYLANLEEALEEFPAARGDSSLANLPPQGFEAAVIKHGQKGVTLIRATREGRVEGRVDAFVVDVPSTIGSGDVFAGALSSELARGSDIEEAAVLANAAAAAFLESGGDPLADRLVGRSRSLSNR